jgi:transcriptional regulator with XRE-family HTH domain
MVERLRDVGFGERLRSLRKEAGLTLTELSAKAGMHLQAIFKLEAGEREPSWSSVLALADALGVALTAFDPKRRRPKPRIPAKRKP